MTTEADLEYMRMFPCPYRSPAELAARRKSLRGLAHCSTGASERSDDAELIETWNRIYRPGQTTKILRPLPPPLEFASEEPYNAAEHTKAILSLLEE